MALVALSAGPRWLGLAAGVVYVAALIAAPRGPVSRWSATTLLAVALGMRAVMWLAPPVAHADYSRYLWDGAVTASGRNPYQYSPQQAARADLDDPGIRALARRGGAVLADVSHPTLRTTYPPAAQALFAVAYWTTPFDVTGWRVVLLALDALAAVLILSLLRSAGLPAMYLLVYLWNPLVAARTHLDCHVDLAAGVFVLLFAWALWRRRVVSAALALAAAVGVKLWPAILVFFLVRAAWKDWPRLAAALAAFVAATALMAIPYSAALGGGDSGLAAYARDFQGDLGAYWFFHKAGWWLWGKLPLDIDGRLVGRALMMLALLGTTAWLAAAKSAGPQALCRRIAYATLVALLLSPALWPWYYVPVVPLAAVAPRPSLLAWSLLLFLYWVPRTVLPGAALVWLVHLPAWGLLLAEPVVKWLVRRRAGRAPAGA